jgi:hypothetical protein
VAISYDRSDAATIAVELTRGADRTQFKAKRSVACKPGERVRVASERNPRDRSETEVFVTAR